MVELCSKLECTGCGACLNVCPQNCIEMIPDNEGFMFPIIDSEKCIDCKRCVRKCPILSPVKEEEEPLVYAAYSLDDKVRRTSSSGGLFYTIAEFVITKGGVVFGAAFDDNMNLSHCYSETLEGLNRMKGSKYLQSNMNKAYKDVIEFLGKNKIVLFTGTPCQVAACKKVVPEHLRKNLILVDIICHGVPSQKVFKSYLTKLSVLKGNDIKSFSFRKIDGWDIEGSITLNNKKVVLADRENVYINLFLKSYLHRECCYDCKYAVTPRCSDVTIADFWGIDKTQTSVLNVNHGVSLILINNAIGIELLNELSDKLYYEKRTLKEASLQNHQLYCSSFRPEKREIMYKYFDDHSLSQVYLRFFFKIFIRRFVGRVLRKLRLRK